METYCDWSWKRVVIAKYKGKCYSYGSDVACILVLLSNFKMTKRVLLVLLARLPRAVLSVVLSVEFYLFVKFHLIAKFWF